jgi:hypothetical protein
MEIMQQPASSRPRKYQLRKRLKEVQHAIAKLTDRTPPLPKKITFFDECTLSSPRFCGHWEGADLALAQQVLNRPVVLDAILFREMYLALLPSTIRAVSESADLGLLCAYINFDDAQRERLVKIWQAVSPRRYFGDIIYHAPLSLTMFNRTTRGTFLKLLLPYLDEAVTSPRTLTSIEYIDLIAAFMFNYASPLSEQEVKVIHLLQEHPNAGLEELQSISATPARKLNAHLQSLREKLYFSKYYRINYPKIRLSHVMVLAYPASGSRIDDYIELCPYLRKIHRFSGENAPYLISYNLPRLRLRRLREFFQELNSLGHLSRFQFYQLDGTFQSYNLQSYLAHKADTPIGERFRWMAWIQYLKENLIDQGYGEVLPKPFIYEYSEPYVEAAELDALDFNILSQISPETPIETIAKQIGQPPELVQEKQRRLFEEQVIFNRPEMSLFQLGLNESVFVMIEGNMDVVQNFLSGCKEAPMAGGAIFTRPTPGCIVAFGLPSGKAPEVKQELKRRFLDQDEFDAAVYSGNGSKDFIVSSVLGRCRFNTTTNQWIWYREYLPTIFDYVESRGFDCLSEESESTLLDRVVSSENE